MANRLKTPSKGLNPRQREPKRPSKVPLILLIATLTLLPAATRAQCQIDSDHISPFKWSPPPLNEPYPVNFTWGNADKLKTGHPVNYLSQMKNQHIPFYCGSCWAQAASSSLSDRLSILRNGSFPEIDVSVQPLLDCDLSQQGCHGGDHHSALAFIHKNKIADASCAPYTSLSWREGRECNSASICQECLHSGACVPKKASRYFTVSEYGLIKGQEQMKREIFTRGPISCSVDSTPMSGYTGGIITQKSDDHNHAISVVGWGVENGVDYWLVRNSWGGYWGYGGYFKVLRDDNSGGIYIQNHCSYGVPVIVDENGQKIEIKKIEKIVKNEGVEEVRGAREVSRNRKRQKKVKIGSFGRFIKDYQMTSPGFRSEIREGKEANPFNLDHLPDSIPRKTTQKPNKLNPPCQAQPLSENAQEILSRSKATLSDGQDSLPAQFSWQDHKPTNPLSWTINQNAPNYCAASWAQATLSSLADRLNIKNSAKNEKISFSAQQVLNCGAGGNCLGGSLSAVYKFAHLRPLVEYGCQVYTASNPTNEFCTNLQICKDCLPKEDLRAKEDTQEGHNKARKRLKSRSFGLWSKIVPRPSTCGAVKYYQKFKVQAYGRVKGVDNIKNEVLNHGPVSCGIHVTQKFKNEYKGGIYEEEVDPRSLGANFAVSVVGWGVETPQNGQKVGREYWIGRSSWGTFWGEEGYFRIVIGEGGLGLGLEGCYWGDIEEVTQNRENGVFEE